VSYRRNNETFKPAKNGYKKKFLTPFVYLHALLRAPLYFFSDRIKIKRSNLYVAA
jgi:hypothetical protein